MMQQMTGFCPMCGWMDGAVGGAMMIGMGAAGLLLVGLAAASMIKYLVVRSD
ncbi:hypothetical protein IEI94_07545 [Halomonas sp. ML-15]|uniref:hypothetical protein n=1 Tax=Halomonas sp. ML-15 TaxID=2773305 RepID=UPI001745F6D3|nr:hypothetical protein [Halomonas sp. ML-15]MBD3895705.1 hypothetical protein [Halomonas sp. ML-15]